MKDFLRMDKCRIPVGRAFKTDNYAEFFKQYQWLLGLWLFTAYIDACSTALFMVYTGPENEIHLVTRACAEYFGTNAGPFIAGFIKLAVTLPFMVIIARYANIAIWYGIIFQVFATYHNFLVWDSFHRPGILHSILG